MNLPLPLTCMSEDCLYLSIYTPAHTHNGSNLPVHAIAGWGVGGYFLCKKIKKNKISLGPTAVWTLLRSLSVSGP